MKELICAYLRVSTAQQRDEQTIASQRHALNQYCQLHGIEIDPRFRFEDDGVSGGTEIHKRPRGSELYGLVSTGKVKLLLLFHADRIGRDTIDSLLFHRLAESQGTRIIGIADGTDTQREGSTFVNEMRSVIAAELRRDCARRVKAGLRRRASEGKISTKPPFGYTVVDGRLIIDESRSHVIRHIFERVARGERTRDIVHSLNETHALSPRGNGWRHDTFITILRNRVYAGEFISFRTPRRQRGGGKRSPREPSEQVIIPCPQIVTPALFEAVQDRILFNRTWCSTSGKRFYLLKSLIRCGNCGHAFVGHAISSRKYKDHRYPDFRYYECGSLCNRDYQFCGNVRVGAFKLEKIVWEQIEAFISSPTTIIEQLRACYNRKRSRGASTIEHRLKKIQREKARNVEARDRLALAVARGVLGDQDAIRAGETLAQEFLVLEKEETELNYLEQESATQRRQMINAEALLTALRDRLIEGFTPEKKAEIVRRLVRQAVVRRGANGRPSIAVQYMFPTSVSFAPVGFALSASSRKK